MTEPPDVESLAKRYLDLWQRQAVEMAADPDLAAAVERLVASAFAGSGGPAGRQDGTASDGRAEQPTDTGRDGRAADAASRSAADRAAPGGGDDRVAELARRIAECQARLAALASKAGTGGGGSDGGSGAGRS